MKVLVVVHPNSKKPRIERNLLGTLHVYVHEQPIEGKANRAVAGALAKHFEISKSKVKLIRGEKFKQKVFEVEL
jgi:hypothetical protein